MSTQLVQFKKVQRARPTLLKNALGTIDELKGNVRMLDIMVHELKNANQSFKDRHTNSVNMINRMAKEIAAKDAKYMTTIADLRHKLTVERVWGWTMTVFLAIDVINYFMHH